MMMLPLLPLFHPYWLLWFVLFVFSHRINCFENSCVQNCWFLCGVERRGGLIIIYLSIMCSDGVIIMLTFLMNIAYYVMGSYGILWGCKVCSRSSRVLLMPVHIYMKGLSQFQQPSFISTQFHHKYY